MKNLVKIKLYGPAAEKLGKDEWNIDAKSVAEALYAVNVLTKNKFNYFIGRETKNNIDYTVYANGELVNDEKDIGINLGSDLKTIDVMPALEGRELTYLAWMIIWTIISSLVTYGISKLMQAKDAETIETNPSYLMDGTSNLTKQGLPVPIGYGRMLVGSLVISQAIRYSELESENSVTSNVVSTEIPGAWGICDGNDGYMYVTSDSAGAIYKLDKSSGAISVYVSFASTYGLRTIVDGLDGHLYTHNNVGNMFRIDKSNADKTSMFSSSEYPTYLIKDGSSLYSTGYLYWLSNSGDTLYKISRDTTGSIGTLSLSLDGPSFMVIGEDGYLYISTSNGRIYRYPTSIGSTSVSQQFSGVAKGIAYASSGVVYVAFASGSVIKYNFDTTESTTIASGLSSPECLIKASDGNLYLTDAVDGTLKRIKTDGSGVTTVASSLGVCRSVVEADNGFLYVTSYTQGKVYKLSKPS